MVNALVLSSDACVARLATDWAGWDSHPRLLRSHSQYSTIQECIKPHVTLIASCDAGLTYSSSQSYLPISTGGTRTLRHLGLSQAALPVCVPCLGKFSGALHAHRLKFLRARVGRVFGLVLGHGSGLPGLALSLPFAALGRRLDGLK